MRAKSTKGKIRLLGFHGWVLHALGVCVPTWTEQGTDIDQIEPPHTSIAKSDMTRYDGEKELGASEHQLLDRASMAQETQRTRTPPAQPALYRILYPEERGKSDALEKATLESSEEASPGVAMID